MDNLSRKPGFKVELL
jgi:hypothetical protein